MTGPITVTWRIGKWYVAQGPPENFVVASYIRKRDAVTAARAVAIYAGVELVVHRIGGRFHWRNSYGGDSPRRPG
jgi:hypothetical protein